MRVVKAGDIYFNPYYGDDWIIRVVREKDLDDKEVLVAIDLYADLDVPTDEIDLSRMVYIANVYDIVEDELIKREEQSN